LTVAALRNALVLPCGLNPVWPCISQALDCCYGACSDLIDAGNATTHWFVIDENRARTAQANATAVLGSCKRKSIAQYPEQGSVTLGINDVGFSIDVECDFGHILIHVIP